MRKFEFVGTGAESGWLIVTSVDLARIGKNRSHFSNVSLISPSGQIALDHAGDALVFLRAWNAKFGPYELVSSEWQASEVATWSPFGSRGIDPPSFTTAADFNQDIYRSEYRSEAG